MNGFNDEFLQSLMEKTKNKEAEIREKKTETFRSSILSSIDLVHQQNINEARNEKEITKDVKDLSTQVGQMLATLGNIDEKTEMSVLSEIPKKIDGLRGQLKQIHGNITIMLDVIASSERYTLVFYF